MFTAAHLRVPRRDRTILVTAVTAVVVAAWLALWLLEASPYGRFLHHDTPAGLGTAVELGLFVTGWTVMIVAMMLPTSLPLLATFGAIVGRRRRPGVLVALAVGGYVATWSAFGLAAWIGDRGIHAAVSAVPWLAEHSRIVPAATLAVAGAYQFTPLKYRCLDACRSPLGFVLNRWRGVAERREAFAMGLAHGLFCVGCCWSLMLVLGAITAIEKNVAWGSRISRPLGAILLLAGLAVVNG